MERLQVGEFEELVLLITAILNGSAYGVSVKDEILEQTGRKINISAVHTALDRLEKKGFLDSKIGGVTPDRGGRRKRIFGVNQLGIEVIILIRETRNRLFKQIPQSAFNLMSGS